MSPHKHHLSFFELRMAKDRSRRAIERALFIGLSILAIILAIVVVYLYI